MSPAYIRTGTGYRNFNAMESIPHTKSTRVHTQYIRAYNPCIIRFQYHDPQYC